MSASKKKEFIVPVYFKVKARSLQQAEAAVTAAVKYGLTETTCATPPKTVKGWSFVLNFLLGDG